MALQTDHERLESAWRALAGEVNGEGWRTIPINMEGTCRLLAGRHFPGNEEAILVGFDSVRMPSDRQLPQGRGFRVENVRREIPGDKQRWVSLSRQSAGNQKMFASMAEDVLGMLRAYDHVGEETLFHLFLGRIKAWQEFMEKGRDGILGPEAEVGLFGEITLLRMIMTADMPAGLVVESWLGPLDGLQDFSIGTGAIEVKSTLVVNGFPATVGSLEQLDATLIQPLFLAGIRLSLDDSGKTLAELIDETCKVLSTEPNTQGLFESLVLRAGFLRAFSCSYTRRFQHTDTKVIPVAEGFPSLTRSNVGVAIRKARYELDLDLVNVPTMELNNALEALGAI